VTTFLKRSCFVAGIAVLSICYAAVVFAAPTASTGYVITNDDSPSGNTATFYAISQHGKLIQKAVIPTGGTGLGTGTYATARVSLLHDKTASCVYVSNAGSSSVTAIDEAKLKRVGIFKASRRDDGKLSGIGLSSNQHYLYAAFSTSGTIATYKILSGCRLQFVKDVAALGIGGGAVDGMAIHAALLVVAYGDGSIESFNISKGVPVSNHDEQNSTGFNTNLRPAGVDITQDGHYAIFGDVPVKARYTTIEISDISKGKLTPTIVYGGYDGSLGKGLNSNNVELSPDESLIYVSNNQGGTVTAVFFNKATGLVSQGCVSSPLRGFGSSWNSGGALALQNNTSGNGKAIFLAEYGNGAASGIGILGVKSNGSACSLTELGSSPVPDPQSLGLLSLGSFPPRSF
jgi:hypothetical protein